MARKKRLTKAEKENAILRDQVAEFQTIIWRKDRAITDLKSQLDAAKVRSDNAFQSIHELRNHAASINDDLMSLRRMATSYGMEPAPDKPKQDISLERHFGRVEATIRAVCDKHLPINSIAMTAGEVEYRNKNRSAF